MLKAGLSVEEAVNMSTDVDVMIGFTSMGRKSAALFLAPKTHSKVILYVASSKLHLLTLLLVFFPSRNHASGLWLFLTVMSAPCK